MLVLEQRCEEKNRARIVIEEWDTFKNLTKNRGKKSTKMDIDRSIMNMICIMLFKDYHAYLKDKNAKYRLLASGLKSNVMFFTKDKR